MKICSNNLNGFFPNSDKKEALFPKTDPKNGYVDFSQNKIEFFPETDDFGHYFPNPDTIDYPFYFLSPRLFIAEWTPSCKR